MTTVSPPSHDNLATAGWQIRQLTEPITIGVRQTDRHRRVHWNAVEHPSLLDQLREAVTSGQSTATRETIRRRHRESSPPFYNEAAAAILSGIYVGISTWHARLHLPSPDRSLDWQNAVLRQLAARLAEYDHLRVPVLAPSIAEDLAGHIGRWWTDAARAVGWQLDDLRNSS